MKVRNGFVSNSSSSSFSVTDPSHKGLQILLDYGNVDFVGGIIIDLDDNATWHCLYEHGIDGDEFLEQISFDG